MVSCYPSLWSQIVILHIVVHRSPGQHGSPPSSVCVKSPRNTPAAGRGLAVRASVFWNKSLRASCKGLSPCRVFPLASYTVLRSEWRIASSLPTWCNTAALSQHLQRTAMVSSVSNTGLWIIFVVKASWISSSSRLKDFSPVHISCLRETKHRWEEWCKHSQIKTQWPPRVTLAGQRAVILQKQDSCKLLRLPDPLPVQCTSELQLTSGRTPSSSCCSTRIRVSVSSPKPQPDSSSVQTQCPDLGFHSLRLQLHILLDSGLLITGGSVWHLLTYHLHTQRARSYGK